MFDQCDGIPEEHHGTWFTADRPTEMNYSLVATGISLGNTARALVTLQHCLTNVCRHSGGPDSISSLRIQQSEQCGVSPSVGLMPICLYRPTPQQPSATCSQSAMGLRMREESDIVARALGMPLFCTESQFAASSFLDTRFTFFCSHASRQSRVQSRQVIAAGTFLAMHQARRYACTLL